MAKQVIDNSGITDTLAAGMGKVNGNFTELYNAKIPVGTVIDYIGTNAPDKWLLLDGQTIGNISSGAYFSDNEVEDLFILLWESISNTDAPVSGGRGASAAADFAANKTITLPNAQGKVAVGYGAGSFTTMGQSIGAETHTLTEAELPVVESHTHLIGGSFGAQYGVDDNAISTISGSNNSDPGGGFGSGDAHNNIQPSLVLNKIIKY